MLQKQLEELKGLCLCKTCSHKNTNYQNCEIAKDLYAVCIKHSGKDPSAWLKLLIRQCPERQGQLGEEESPERSGESD